MEYKTFQRMLEEKMVADIDRKQFEQTAREMYDVIGAERLNESQLAPFVRVFESGAGWGVYFMSSLLAGCAKAGTIVAYGSKKNRIL